MTSKSSDFLSLYAGLDITQPTTGTEAAIHQVLSCFFNKVEKTLTQLQPKSNRINYKGKRTEAI